MTKKKRKKYSRLNPAYLASRHAGPLFMFLAMGLLAGMAWRSLAQPTKYAAHATATVSVAPPGTADTFDWEAKEDEWRGWLETSRDRDLLCVNLRFAVKLAATADALLDTELLDEKLAAFGAGESFSASFFPNRFLARLGPVITVTRRDLASYMDFRSLATIIADLDPSHENTGGWDFSFFRNPSPEQKGNGIIIEPGSGDPHFQVFFRLHELVRGEPADTPFAAWRTAVDEFAARLEREAEFAGGGGFGPAAKREILREITAIPALAANGLYRVNDWFAADAVPGGHAGVRAEHWGTDTSIKLRHTFGDDARVTVSAATLLHPVAYVRDTVYTRLPPLAAATLIAFLAAREEMDAGEASAAETAGEAAPASVEPVPATPVPSVPASEEPADFVAELEPLGTPEAAETTEKMYREIVDETAAKARLDRIAGHEDLIAATRIQRDAASRRLDTARDAENRLSREAVAARVRADALRARVDDAVAAAGTDDTPHVPPETARLFRQRDEVFARLTTLLQYCTEEHPFVRQARRELDALEAQLSGAAPDDGANKAAEERATVAAGLRLEWEVAVEQADALEERQRRQSEETAALLEAMTGLEQCMLQYDRELALAKASPVPVMRQEIPQELPAAPAVAEPPPAVKPPPPAIKPPPAAPAGTHLVFASLPADTPLEATPPGWQAPWAGLVGGLCLGGLWAMLRELFSSRFRNAAEARRMTRLPVLAALPAYDMRSLKSAAAAMKGEVTRATGGQCLFTPSQVEYSEPPPEARRGKILPVAGRPRFMTWAFGLLFIILAGLLYYRSLTGFAQPRLPGGARELPLPGTTVPAWMDEGKEWGDLP